MNIGGSTIHTALSISKTVGLPYQPLGEDLLNTVRSTLHSLQILIIDEISMVDKKMFACVHGRLCQVKQTGYNAAFGKVNLLVLGDFQLPPVKGKCLYKQEPDDFLDLWGKHFKFVELDEIMRQREDASFACLLNRLRVHPKATHLSDADTETLRSRIVNPDSRSYPDNALHIYATNRQVDTHNEHMLNQLGLDQIRVLLVTTRRSFIQAE